MIHCCCDNTCPSTIVTFTVHGCGSTLLSGALCTVTQGATTIGTCTTDATGTCTVSIPANGTYSYAIAATNYTTATGTFTVTSCANASVSRTLAAAPGYQCIFIGDCSPLIVPTTNPTLTDSVLGTGTFGGSPPGGCMVYSGTGYSWLIDYAYPGCLPNCFGFTSPDTTPIYFCMTCGPGPGPNFQSEVYCRFPFSPTNACPCESPFLTGCNYTGLGNLTLSSYTLSPPMLQFTYSSLSNVGTNLYCGSTPTITITWP